jgi:hypothetical protein
VIQPCALATIFDHIPNDILRNTVPPYLSCPTDSTKDPGILAAIGIRETNFRNITGDFGHGHGIFQIDDRFNANAVSFAGDTQQAADFAAGLLVNRYDHYIAAGYSPALAEAGAIRDYNGTGGIPTRVLLNTGYIPYADLGTTHNNYVTTVISIAAACF